MRKPLNVKDEVLAGARRAGFRRVGESFLPTRHGKFTATAYQDQAGKDHLALRMGVLTGEPPLLRIHSQCLTGDILGSLRCDCGDQLQMALRRISDNGRGLLIYLQQEGRGIGLGNKIRAYALQDEGLDTVEANHRLGFDADLRDFQTAVDILKDLRINAVRLMTNNPRKVRDLETGGVSVVERIPLLAPNHAERQHYIATKAGKMGHIF